MKNPNLACDIFKILLAEHISHPDCNGHSFTTNPDRYLDKYAIDALIIHSFKISDQLLEKVDADPEIIAIRKKQQALAQAQAPQPQQPAKPIAKPKK